MAKAQIVNLLPALVSDGRLAARDAEILARYWDERDSDADNLEAIGYWLALRRHTGGDVESTRREADHPWV